MHAGVLGCQWQNMLSRITRKSFLRPSYSQVNPVMHKTDHASLHHSPLFGTCRTRFMCCPLLQSRTKRQRNIYWPRRRFSDTWASINFWSRGQETDIRPKRRGHGQQQLCQVGALSKLCFGRTYHNRASQSNPAHG